LLLTFTVFENNGQWEAQGHVKDNKVDKVVKTWRSMPARSTHFGNSECGGNQLRSSDGIWRDEGDATGKSVWARNRISGGDLCQGQSFICRLSRYRF
jgi:hypothetical protein